LFYVVCPPTTSEVTFFGHRSAVKYASTLDSSIKVKTKPVKSKEEQEDTMDAMVKLGRHLLK
jgi:hypothetical protein